MIAHLVPLRLIKGEFAQCDSLNDLLVSLTIERWVAAEEDVQNDATAPQIALLIVAFLQNLWRDVIRCTVLLGQLLAWDKLSRRPEVNDSNTGLVT